MSPIELFWTAKKPHNAGNSRTIVGTRRSHFYFAGYVSSDPDESDVNNHPGSEVVYLQEVLWIPGVINTALHWNIRHSLQCNN